MSNAERMTASGLRRFGETLCPLAGDWRCKEQYPKENVSAAQWAWEFLRRNAEYKKDYETVLRAPPNERNDAGESMSHKWNILEMIAPEDPGGCRFWTGATEFVLDRFTEPRMARSETASRYVKYDLNKPLTPQIKGISALLHDDQKRLRGFHSTRNRKNIYPTYLRILDAKMAKASNRTIAAVLFQELAGDELAGLQRVKEYLGRANRLRENPLAILVT